MTPEARALFVVAERIGCSVTVVEQMSAREVRDWIRYLTPPATAGDAIDLNALTKQQKRALFKR